VKRGKNQTGPLKKCQWYAAIHENSEHKALFNVLRWDVIAINLSDDQLKQITDEHLGLRGCTL
jgi:hypothetical protein